jgi:DnaK suppressor protein
MTVQGVFKVDTQRYKQRLVALEHQLLGRIEREVETARETRDEQPELGDQSHVEELKAEYFSEAENDSAILQQVRDALQRIEEGTFGTCVVDGRPIDEKRLEAVPWTPYCLEHQQELEGSTRSSTL